MHNYLHDRYDSLHDTPLQRHFRSLAPMPLGVVFIAWAGIQEDEVREQMRTIKSLGYTCLKGVMGCDRFSSADLQRIALEEGLWPWWYAEGGWEPITPQLLSDLGLPSDLTLDEAMEHPAMLAHQRAVAARRLERQDERRHVSTCAGGKSDFDDENAPPEWLVPSVVGAHRGHDLRPQECDAFIAWLRRSYGSLECLLSAWNVSVMSSSKAVASLHDWEDLKPLLAKGWPGNKEYRHYRDIMRFHADMLVEGRIARAIANRHAFDRDEPIRAGGEAGLFLPFAARGVDMEGIATAIAEDGSFYPSMHPSWHLEEVEFELLRPTYMQASVAADWAKGIWSATWESTGGPQYFSGGKAPFVPEVRDMFPGATVDAGTMTQLMFSYLAAGFKGFGLWCWNARPAGWEGGEYALCDRNNAPTARARQVGVIGQATRRWRRELWQAHKEPTVGLLVDWDNEAIWAAMAITGREMYRSVPVRARIGAARALIDANIPFEHVTTANLRDGLGPRYPAIYLPAMLTIGEELMTLLTDYVQQGGHLVIDMPGAYYNDCGRVFATAEGTAFELLFGCVLHEFAFANPRHTPNSIAGLPCGGFLAELSVTKAEVLAHYDHGDAPAITSHRLGAGRAVLIGTQLALDCMRPGNQAAQDLLVHHAVPPGWQLPFTCSGAIAYRLAAPGVDHLFLVTDGDEAQAEVRIPGLRSAEDALDGSSVDLNRPVRVPARSGRWLRCCR